MVKVCSLPIRALTPRRKHQKELTPLDLTTLDKCAADVISCRSRASPQMHHGHRPHSALLFPRCVCTMCVVPYFLELRTRCLLMQAVCVYTATKWTYGHTFGTWRFLGLSGFATLGAFLDSAVILC